MTDGWLRDECAREGKMGKMKSFGK